MKSDRWEPARVVKLARLAKLRDQQIAELTSFLKRNPWSSPGVIMDATGWTKDRWYPVRDEALKRKLITVRGNVAAKRFALAGNSLAGSGAILRSQVVRPTRSMRVAKNEDMWTERVNRLVACLKGGPRSPGDVSRNLGWEAQMCRTVFQKAAGLGLITLTGERGARRAALAKSIGKTKINTKTPATEKTWADRIEQLTAFLQTHGPTPMREITAKLGWPKWTRLTVIREAKATGQIVCTGRTRGVRVALAKGFGVKAHTSKAVKEIFAHTLRPEGHKINGIGYVLIYQNGEAKAFATASELREAYVNEIQRAGDTGVKIFRLGQQIHARIDVKI